MKLERASKLYRKLAAKYHPDHNPATAEVMKDLNKGGSGKSTITMQLAGVLSTRSEGTRVLVIDADQQGTCLKWAAMAAEDTPFPATVMGMTEPIIHRQLPRIRTDYDFILVDTPPHAEEVRYG